MQFDPGGVLFFRRAFGGFCYFNNNAIAAHYLSRYGRVAVLDIDYHHGNGTQSLFYRDPSVLFVSIHADPTDAFPYFAGFPEESGAGRGLGYNMNLALPRGTDGAHYLRVLDDHVVPALVAFAPDALVLSAGLDTYHLDPVGDFELTTEDLHEVGRRLGRLRLPTAVIQEGGYYTPDLGLNATALLRGIAAGQR